MHTGLVWFLCSMSMAAASRVVMVVEADGLFEGHRRVRMQRFFDQLGVDVVPAADDELLLAARQPEVAFGILPPQVTGVEPALHLATLVRPFDPQPLVVRGMQVALEQVGAGAPAGGSRERWRMCRANGTGRTLPDTGTPGGGGREDGGNPEHFC